MLVCPKCQFQNPNTNKFCQKCGTSLTQKNCPQCQRSVPVSLLNCPHCGATVGTVWSALVWGSVWASAPDPKEAVSTGPLLEEDATTIAVSGQKTLIQPPLTPDADNDDTTITLPSPPTLIQPDYSPDYDDEETTLPFVSPQNTGLAVNQSGETKEATADSPESGVLETAAPAPVTSVCSQEIPTAQLRTEAIVDREYLDRQQRYKILPPLPEQNTSSTDNAVQLRVLDAQPFLLSPLTAWASGNGVLLKQAAGIVSPAANLPDLAVPAMAFPYLKLTEQKDCSFPIIHDAWQENGETVLLLQDRSQLPSLIHEWASNDSGPIQLLNWMYQMTKLWEILEPLSQHQSLLEISNLRVNQHRQVILERLYSQWPEAGLSLKNLGQIWEGFFHHSQRTQLGSVTQLLTDMTDGNIQTVELLRSRLDRIADELARSETKNSADGTVENWDTPTLIGPVQLLSLDSAAASDVGRQRPHNEDYFGADTNIRTFQTPQGRNLAARCLYILCDGMGGHAGGEVASAQAVDSLRDYFHSNWGQELPTEAVIREGVRLANQAIYDVNQKEVRAGIGRMGTTLVLVLLQDTRVAVAHVGDSRLYSLTRRQGLQQITVDHEVGQREIKRGIDPELAYARPDAYQLTQALGPRDENFVNPDVKVFDIQEDTLLILASDGLTDNDLLETYQESYLQPLLSEDAFLDKGVHQLIDLANQHNGHDNITVILIRALVQPRKN